MNMKSMASTCSSLATLLLIAAALIAIFDPLIVGRVNADSTPVTAMFVFGDSYADTGNVPELVVPPYGKTWPGFPAGRFSDGLILTDYIASTMNIETPTPHRNLSLGLGCDDITSGMNFAHGGSGIFRTNPAPEGPTLSCQIDQFRMFSDKCPTIKSLITSSVALVVMVGNDYITYLTDTSRDPLPTFMKSVVKGITDSIASLYQIGFRKFAVANLEPAGCIPYFATNDQTECNLFLNEAVSEAHNTLLSQGIDDIRPNLPEMCITILDQYSSFLTAQKTHFPNNLKPCIRTGKLEDHDVVFACPDPEKFFFWDPIHPTQAAWEVVTDQYKDQIHNLINGIECNGKTSSFK